MIFSFLKYVSPTWYFNRKPRINHGYFPTQAQCEKSDLLIEVDAKFISEEGQKRDLAYRAFQQGLLLQNVNEEQNADFWEDAKLPVQDEYRFLRKNFSAVWVLYVLVIRILSFKNPIKEIKGFLKSRNSNRQKHHESTVKQPNLVSFESNLCKREPKISVIIPTLNRYEYLKDVFCDLEKQTYKNFEVIVVDQTDPFDESVYKGWNLDLKYWYQSEKALWKARNEAIKASVGEYILLYDDDSLVDPDWIEMHIKALDFYQADLSSGVSISAVGDKVPAHYAYFRWSDQLDTGNVLLKKQIFDEIGLFDTQFEKQRMGDGEYGLRAYIAGYRNVSNPLAKRIHLKVGQGGLRQMGSWDAFMPKSFWSVRPIPSVLYFFRKYHGNAAARWSMLKNVPPGIIPYRFKQNKKLLVLGSVIAVILAPIIFVQVWMSWNRASKMLKS